MNKQILFDKLPDHWAIVSLSNICIKASKVKRKELDPDSNFLYLDISSIDNVTNKITGHNQHNWNEAPSRAQQIIQNEDILFSTVRVYLKNIAKVTNPLYSNQICSSGFTVLRAKKDLCHPNFLFVYTLFEGFLNKLCELQTGTSYPAVRDNDVFTQKIPLPPLPEQSAIVSKIEQLFSELDNGIANLKLAQEQLKVYRQAVLKQAFTGELTRRWREEQTDLPDAEDLLEEIRREREKIANTSRKMQKTVRNDYEEVVIVLPDLPIGWRWIKLHEICSLMGGVTKGRKLDNKDTIFLPYLRVANVQDGYLDLSEIKYIEVLKDDLEKYRLIEGDILYTEGGDKDKLGRGTVWKEQILDCIHQNHVFRARPFLKTVSSSYIGYFSQTEMAKKYFFKKGKQTVNLASINITVLSNLPFPLCSLSEQRAIVTEIETRLSVCDRLNEDITDALEKAEALRQSILKQAFEGRLLSEEELTAVRNDPEWEPAEALLAKITSKTI